MAFKRSKTVWLKKPMPIKGRKGAEEVSEV